MTKYIVRCVSIKYIDRLVEAKTKEDACKLVEKQDPPINLCIHQRCSETFPNVLIIPEYVTAESAREYKDA